MSNELTITIQSTSRVLRLHNAKQLEAGKRTTAKLNGKMIKAACDLLPEMIHFEDRSFFGTGACYSYMDLLNMGWKSVLVRCNQDRDVLMIKVK